jgi:transglutaminase-like putative cysteine protease
MKKLFLLIAIAILATACSNNKECTALSFLNASMPYGDAIDYSEDYFLKNIQTSFKAKKELPWGKRVPEREFKHFVLPIRVNNENLDDFRMAYYEELRDRVKDLSMYDAVLEVNHWCHEKVNYKGSDSRTSSPMATIKTSWGRCGEESTLLVSALRAVCIPARQVYVPRWAHCDDNHAWVEAWVDGKWHFLGACEPEPVLDLGWFNAPASRALLVHTRVFGDYDGPEEVISKTPYFTEINVIDNYAETAKLNVTVVDRYGNAVPDARVDFKIYNYSEYHTVATKYTDYQGYTWLTAGLGKMMVYASKDGKIGYKVAKIGDVKNVEIKITDDYRWFMDNFDLPRNRIEKYDVDIIPPAENARIPKVSDEMRAENNRRLAHEDSIRNAYIAKCVAAQNEGDYDKEIMAKTWGNYQTIKDFVDYAREKGMETEAYKILNVITDKDLRDVTLDVLVDCLDNCEFDDEYIYNPRVSNEMLRPYRTQLTHFDNVTDVIEFVRDSIEICDALNVQRTPISPAGVLRSRHADSHSRDIFFVALARTAGIPSRIDPVTGKVQYFDNQWIDIDFTPVETFHETSQKPGTLVIKYQGADDPRYYTHFSIKKFNGNTFDLLAYDAMDPGMDVGMTLSQMMADGGITLDPGYYALSYGPRLADGSVLNRLMLFWIESGETTNIEMKMRKPGIETSQNVKSQLRIVAYLDGGSEPTTHAMQEISILKDEFEKWGGEIVFYFKDENDFSNFKSKKFNNLPKYIVHDINENMPSENLPVFMILNDEDAKVFEAKGYQIGLGEQMLNVLK